MQMFMVAPMAAPTPIAMPQFDSTIGSDIMSYGSMSQLGNMPFVWTPEASWQPYHHAGTHFFAEEAPQQFPMVDAVEEKEMPINIEIDSHVFDANAHDTVSHCQEEVPMQIQMDYEQSYFFQPQAKRASNGVSTLRRRKGAEGASQNSCGLGADTMTMDDGQADHDAQSDAQAREIAQQMIQQLRAGDDAQWSAVAAFERLAFSSKVNSRAAQIILEETSMADAAAFAAGLRGHIRNAVQSKHANHVVQKITEVMPVARASFVVDELKGFGHALVRHCFGCRVMCRILEHLSPEDASTLELVDEILTDVEDLCSHSFGSFVIRHLLEFGFAAHKHQIVLALRTDLIGFAKHKFGSHVVEAALRHSAFEDQQDLSKELLADKEQLLYLSGNQFGRHVVRAMLTMPADLKKEAVNALRPMESQLKASRYGKSVVQVLRTASV
jgi:hypothetical protein